MGNELAWAAKGKEWLVTNGADLAVNLVLFLLIIIIGKAISKAICVAADKALRKSSRVSDMLRNFAVDVLNKVLFAIVLMVALQRLGVDIAPLIAGLGVTGFVLGFAFQGALGNLAAGVMILLNEPFKIGDIIEAAGHTGSVKELNLMATIIATPDNKKITIPNGSIWGGSIVNFSTNDTRRVDLTVGIGYDDDIAKAQEIIAGILKNNEKVLDDPAPAIKVVELADSSVNFAVRPWSKTEDYWDVYFDVTRKVKEEFDRVGIGIPYPQMDIHHHGLPHQN